MAARKWSDADQIVFSAFAEGVALAQAGSGFISGGVPSQRGAGANLSIDVSAATWVIAGVQYTTGGVTNVAVTTAPTTATYTRQDLVWANASGIGYTAGVASAPPSDASYPDPVALPAGAIPIALIEVGNSVTQILDARIVDIRSITHYLTLGDPHTQYATNAEYDDHSARHESGGADVLANATVSAAGYASAADKRLLAYYSAGNSGASLTIDWNNGASQHVTLTANCTFTFSNPAQPGWYALRLAQDATGSRTATWPATVKWSGGTTPTLTTTASRVDLVTFYWDGAAYLGASILNYSV